MICRLFIAIFLITSVYCLDSKQNLSKLDVNNSHSPDLVSGGGKSFRGDSKFFDNDAHTSASRRPLGHLPYIVVGFMKCGTRSLKSFFSCGGLRVAHQHCLRKNHTEKVLCSRCVRDNLAANRPPLYDCGDYDVYTQLDSEFPPNNCYFPQIDALDELSRQFPRATFLLNLRPFEHWYRSLDGWKKNLRARLANCSLPGMPRNKRKLSHNDLKKLLDEQVARVTNFWRTHPQHRLVEIDIESEWASHTLHKAFNIDATCWGHINKNLALVDDDDDETDYLANEKTDF
mmetsp:Transcript_9434/g.16019  ORF Transcript_9434/g.16019 Transcript_9434/m.16019 type:complete len:287 (+) Transcript_9434:31-891(+)